MSQWIATYRLQLNQGFGFERVMAIAAYLAELGISHVYLSPITQAAPGSSHGYDVTDPARLNAELGGEQGYRKMTAALQAEGLGQIVDIVPNHMSLVTPANTWWWDLLENGASSKYRRHFDLGWGRNGEFEPVKVPVLEDRYGKVLEAGKIRLEQDGDRLFVGYADWAFPLAPQSRDALVREADGDVARAAERLNADKRDLHALLEQQHYRLAYWRSVDYEFAYRRFFDINTLIGVRIEDEGVFDDAHALVLRLVQDGSVEGLRIDHVDGLRDPKGYLDRLRSRARGARIVVEKILAPDEPLQEAWPADGTSGYDFLNAVNGLFTDPAGEGRLSDFYARFSGEQRSYAEVLLEKKRFVLNSLFAGDLADLARLLVRVCNRYAEGRDWPPAHLEAALLETIAAMPVYRTYVQPERGELGAEDASIINGALAEARSHLPDVDPEVFGFLRSLLLMERRGEQETEFVLRFQQLCAPATAKGAEDTAFYCYNRLVSLNEVGGEPDHFGLSLQRFHAFSADNARRWPLTMLATSTHDTKRGEDTRLRIDLLSEMPDEWVAAVERWTAMNERFRTDELPDRNAEYLLYQVLVGAWPLSEERANEYMLKAAREAKVHTSWRGANETYEMALREFVAGVLGHAPFLQDLGRFVDSIKRRAWIASLSQTLVKLTAPGVPDLYQGSELWEMSLVDPDNRRPVDYEMRSGMLKRARTLSAAGVLQELESGLPKLWLTWKALTVRHEHPDAFAPGAAYEPLYATGAKKEHVVAFSRGHSVLTVAPRLLAAVEDGWASTTLPLPAGRWRDALADQRYEGGDVTLESLLRQFPVALLVREEGE